MHGVNLMAHPLTRLTRGVRPEQSELKMLARIEWLCRPVHLESLPVGILLKHLFNKFFSPPAAGLIDIPRELHHRDGTKLAFLDVVGRGVIVLAAPAL